GRAVERALALAAVEARVLSAGEHRPNDALAIHIHSTGREALFRRLGVVPRHFVILSERRLGRMRSRNEMNQRTRHSENRSPHRTVRGGRVAIIRYVDALILGWIRRLIRLGIRVALPVPVVIEDERAPTLGFLFVMSLVPNLGVEPALYAGGSERRP